MSPLKIALLLSYICVASVSAAMITPALPIIEQTFHLAHGALEWVVSIFLFGYVIGQLPYGPLANRFGRIRALQIGLIINCLGIVLCILAAAATNFPLLLIGRLVTALGAASGLACTFMILHESLSPERAKHALSFAIVSFTVGIGLAVTIGGVLTQYLSWTYCFWVLLIHGLLMLYFTTRFEETLKQPISLHPVIIAQTLLHAARNKQLVIFSLVIGFTSVFSYGYSAAAPMYTQLTLHLSASEYGYYNLVNMVGMLSSGFLGAFLIKRYGPKYLLIFAISFIVPSLLSLCLLVMAHAASVIWFFATTTALYLFSGLLFPAGSYFASHAITDKASASCMMSFINMGSAMLGVVVLGYLPFSPALSFFIVLVIFFVGLLLLTLPYLFAKKSLVLK